MKKIALIGEKLGHSHSPKIHNLIAKNEYSYELQEVAKTELASFMKTNKYDGFNVTIPYKTEVINYMDKLDESAKKIGAVNTVIKDINGYTGYNTDYFGLKHLIDLVNVHDKNSCVLILGSGGTSKTAQAICKELFKKTYVACVMPGADFNYETLYSVANDVNLIINTTPVGMYPQSEDKLLVDLDKFKNLLGVVDVVYNPLKTKLIFEAEKRGIKAVGGLKMLTTQAVFASKYFSNLEVNEKINNYAYENILNDVLSIVLIGMPSSGKSVVGKALAKRLNKKFVDIDSEVVKKAKKSVPEIFKEDGEKHFRELELVALATKTKENCQVIATGGGSVTLNNAHFLMAQNSKVVYIKRDFSLASTKDRPLLKDPNAMQTLYEKRRHLYEQMADLTVYNNGSVESVVEEIVLRMRNY